MKVWMNILIMGVLCTISIGHARGQLSANSEYTFRMQVLPVDSLPDKYHYKCYVFFHNDSFLSQADFFMKSDTTGRLVYSGLLPISGTGISGGVSYMRTQDTLIYDLGIYDDEHFYARLRMKKSDGTYDNWNLWPK